MSRVIVLGGGVVGCETATALLERNCKVTILEMLNEFARGLENANKIDLMAELAEGGTELISGAKVDCVDGNTVVYNGTEKVMADCVVVALGEVPQGRQLKAELEEREIPVTVVGDAVRPRKFQSATQEGYFAAINL